MKTRVFTLILIVPALLAVLSLSAPDASFAEPPNVQDLGALVEEALANNPDLKASESRWRMYQQKETPARSLADPRLSFGFSSYPVDSLASDEYAMTGNDLRLDQSIPFPGKLSLKGEIAAQQADWYRAMYLERRTEIVRMVRDAWYRLYSLDQSLRLVGSNLEVIDQLTRLSETRFAVGEGMQQDVLRAQLQRSRLMDRQLSLERDREAVVSELEALLNRGQGSFAPGALDGALDVQDLERALQGMEANRPMLAAYRALIDQYGAQKKLAQRDYWPDLGLWAGYRFRDDNLPDGGEDFVSAGLSLNLPIFQGKRRAAVADAEYGLSMAQAQYREVYNRNVSALQEVHAQLTKGRDLILLYRTGIIPQAQQSYEAVVSAYQVGRVSFLEVMSALSNLYAYQTEYHRALSDFFRSRARFQQLSGADAEAFPIDSMTSGEDRQP